MRSLARHQGELRRGAAQARHRQPGAIEGEHHAPEPPRVTPDQPRQRAADDVDVVDAHVAEAGLAGLGGELPWLTQIVVDASNFVGRFGWLVIIAAIGLYFAIRQYHKTHGGRRIIDSLLLKIPIIGMLLRKIAVARFCRTLATLTSSGVPILDGLEITARTSGNAVIEDAIMAVRKAVEEGKTLSGPLADSKVFPPMVCQMIAVGETTGALDSMLSKIADFYDDEVDNMVANLMSLLEPAVILFLGVVIGGLVVAMYLPIFRLGSVIG